MKDTFDIHEYNNTLRSKLQVEQELTGVDASTKVISFLRKSIYPKLNDQEMDKFIIEMGDHMDLEVPSYRLGEVDLDEDVLPKQTTIALDDLTFDLLDNMFDNIKPGIGGLQFPTSTDASFMVGDIDDLERWKVDTRAKYGNVNIRLDVEASAPYNKVKVLDDGFLNDRDRYIDGKAQALKGYSSKD